MRVFSLSFVCVDATFPASGETDTERVVNMLTMDKALNILVPKRSGQGRFPSKARLDAARRARDRMAHLLQGLMGRNSV